MTEPIGYNDDQFDDLPAEDASWEKMRQLLDKDERRRRGIPLWLRLSALVFLVAALGIGGWVLFSGKGEVAEPEISAGEVRKGGNNDQPVDQTTITSGKPGSAVKKIKTGEGPTTGADPSQTEFDNGSPEKISPGKPANGEPVTYEKKYLRDETTRGLNSFVRQNSLGVKTKKQSPGNLPLAIKRTNRPVQKKEITTAGEDKTGNHSKVAPIAGDPPVPVIPGKDETQKIHTERAEDKKQEAAVPPVKLADTSAPVTDTFMKKQSAASQDSAKIKEAVAETKEKAKKKIPLQWSMGLAFQQPVALGSQGTSDYNYRGRKSFITDHLPGLYFTAGKNRWYAGAEFSYAVPQAVEQLYFSQVTKYSAGDSLISRERYSIRKIYYHQFSLSGNYRLLPQWTAGAGSSYQLLTGAVTEREVQKTSVANGNVQTLSSLAPVKGYKDSFLFKSTAAAFLQSEYHWKRVRLGVRYTYSLQPYMRYTKPDGQVEDVKNNSLQLLLRFQLWKN